MMRQILVLHLTWLCTLSVSCVPGGEGQLPCECEIEHPAVEGGAWEIFDCFYHATVTDSTHVFDIGLYR